jgi:multiple sugar transport system substrate-binding protein
MPLVPAARVTFTMPKGLLFVGSYHRVVVTLATKSKLNVDTLRFVVPAGPKGQYSATYGDGIGVAAASKNKEAAYLLCQWAVSKQQGARLLQAGGGVPFRNSVLNDEEVRKGVTLPKEWFQSVIDAAKISKLGLPVVVPVAEFRDLFGAAVTATLSGADPATELKKAYDQFVPILERSEKTG